MIVASALPNAPVMVQGADDPIFAVRTFADNLIEHARDHYGPKQTPLFVSQLDIKTRTLLPAASKLYISDQRGGAGPTTNNLQFDTGLLRLLYALSKVTGDSKYAAAADEYLSYYLANLPDQRGAFPWGDHRGYDVVADKIAEGVHEFKVAWPLWDAMYRLNPKAVTRQIEALRRHINDPKKSLAFNRHMGHAAHCSLNSSGSAWVAAWAFLHTKTGDTKHLDWARAMADYFWNLRDQTTGLLSVQPFDPAWPEVTNPRSYRTAYMDQMGALPANLLRTSLVLGPGKGDPFRAQALGYMRAFISRMDIQPDGSFNASFEIATGKPLAKCPRVTAAEAWQHLLQLGPDGKGGGVTGLRAPINLAFAYKVTGEADLRAVFDRLVPLFRLERFAKLDGPPEPVSAGLLAQATVALLNMYQGTKEKAYLERAEVLCRYAMAHFYKDGWFVCGVPTVPRYRDDKLDVWRTYSNRGGSADLALAVLRVSLAAKGAPDIVEDDPNPHF